MKICSKIANTLNSYTDPHRDHLWRQLCDLPYFRALLRAVEARFYKDLPIAPPVLDLGSGDGLFAQQTFTRPLDVGIDPFYSPTFGKIFKEGYLALSTAEGAHMPFASNSFQTIISNSVLEHIPDIEPVIAESYRVLKPGGYFIFCSPSDHFTEWFVGAKVLGNAYRDWFQRISRHHHCDSPTTWAQRLAKFGFSVERSWYYFSPKALRTLEMGHYVGAPNLLAKMLFGKWVLWQSRLNPSLRLLEAWLRPIYDEPLPKQGAYVFVVARK